MEQLSKKDNDFNVF